MQRSARQAVLMSAGAYAGALLLGFAVDFRVTLFLLLAIQPTWTLFCAIRWIQLRRADVEWTDREGLAFARAGLLSSLALFAAMVVLTQVV
jgi:hypothetical protein